MPKMTDFLEHVSTGTVIFDGAMGTMVMAAGLPAVKTPELLNGENPTLIGDIHRQYYDAGATVVTSNTFGANALKLGAHGLAARLEELNTAAVDIARQACPAGRFVAGDMGPTGKMLRPLGDLTSEAALEVFARQAAALTGAGVDLIIIETMFALDEALAAVTAARQTGDVPVLASMTFNQTPRGFFTLMGEDVGRCAAALEQAGAHMLGINCSLGSREMVQLTTALRSSTALPILVQPNAGNPVARGGTTVYEQTPAAFARDIARIRTAGADMVGGCCGTTPEFIRAVAEEMNAPQGG